jgi:hypothetical protein
VVWIRILPFSHNGFERTSHRRKVSDPDPLVKSTDPLIQIRTKMSWIPNTGLSGTVPYADQIGLIMDEGYIRSADTQKVPFFVKYSGSDPLLKK